jgi:preprotein translocase subunit SecE
MATKAAPVKSEERPAKPAAIKREERPVAKPAAIKRQEPKAMSNFAGKTMGLWQEFRHFLGDVRGEMRKVVTPTRKEVEATTTVVIVAVFLFGLFFFVVDWIFAFGLDRLLKRLGGLPG